MSERGTQIILSAKQEMNTFLDIAGADFDTVQACMRRVNDFIFNSPTQPDVRQMGEQVVESLEIALGPDHRCVAEALHILGVNYANVGRWSAAARANTMAVRILTGIFGSDHSQVAEIEEHIESNRELQMQVA